MKHVRMGIAILLVLALAAAIFAGCSEPLKDAGEISDYDSQAFIPVGNASEVTNGDDSKISENTTKNGGFVVSEKKYDFEGNDLIVLNVENSTDKNYSIVIKGTYLDENGAILKEEEKNFEGFAAGWQNNFFFTPEIPFDRFTYTLQTEEYEGECLANLFTFYWTLNEYYVDDPSTSKWQETQSAFEEWYNNGQSGPAPSAKGYQSRTIGLSFGYRYDEIPTDLTVHQDFIVFSSDGEIFAVKYYSEQGASQWRVGKGGDGITKYKPFYTFPEDEEDAEWPKELKGDVKVLLSITSVTIDE